MRFEAAVHRGYFRISDQDYEICVFAGRNGRHFAATFFAPEDVIISDGCSLDDTLRRHRKLLPLAIDSRLVLKELRRHS